MSQTTRVPAPGKPAKPYPDFPLFPHATKRWAKKIRGKLHYFGPWRDPAAAEDLYNRQRDDLYAGRTPRELDGELTVRELVNRFLTAKQQFLDAAEITDRTFADYYATCKRLGEQFGLDRPIADLAYDDFDRLRATVAKKWGPVALGNEVQRVRSVFKFAFEAGLIEKPIRFGPHFKKSNSKKLREVRNEKGPRMLEADQIRKLLAAANVPLRAMIFLGINCGFGNSDIGKLPIRALNFQAGWVSFPRPKTGIKRRCPLWPDTVEAVKLAIAKRPSPRAVEHDALVFLTKQGRSWSRSGPDSPVSKVFGVLLKEAGLRKAGLNFYALRHTFETIGGETTDQVAVDAIMGHAPASNDMAAKYRERISDERLVAVTDFVRDWLFGPGKKTRKNTSGCRTAQVRKRPTPKARRPRAKSPA